MESLRNLLEQKAVKGAVAIALGMDALAGCGTKASSQEPATQTVCISEGFADTTHGQVNAQVETHLVGSGTLTREQAEKDAAFALRDGVCGNVVDGIAVRIGGISCKTTEVLAPNDYRIVCTGNVVETTPVPSSPTCAYDSLLSGDSPSCRPATPPNLSTASSGVRE